MGKAAARMNDMVKRDTPHCHTLHPGTPPVAIPHPDLPLNLVSATSPTVKINGMAAATATTISKPCMLPGCVPAGPGMIAMGSMTVLITCMPAAREGDMVVYSSCVAPVPAPVGKVQPPCSNNVKIGG